MSRRREPMVSVESEAGMGDGERSRMSAVKEAKGAGCGVGKSVECRSSCVAAKRSVRSSNSAIWWMRLWMWGTSRASARRSSAHTSPEKVVGAAILVRGSEDRGCGESTGVVDAALLCDEAAGRNGQWVICAIC